MTEHHVKACPFCGGKGWRGGYSVQCGDCGATVIAKSQALADAAWNTRPEPSLNGNAELVERAFREGWRVNAIPADDPATSPEYLDACETADWENSTARAAIAALSTPHGDAK